VTMPSQAFTRDHGQRRKQEKKKDEGKNGKAEMRSEESKVVCIGFLCQDMARVLRVKHFYQTCMNQHDLNAWASFPGPDHGSESFVTASELDSIGWSTITYRVAELTQEVDCIYSDE
jgi:hypothetical protein